MATDTPTTRDVLEQLCWYLSYRADGTITADDIAAELDLDWADAYNYTRFLDVLSNIAPQVSYDHNEHEFHVTKVSQNVTDLLSDSAVAATVYLFRWGMYHGDVMRPLDITEHSVFTEEQRYTDGLADAIELDWVRVENNTATLTPLGVSVAGPSHSEVRNIG
jgi:hypothetical protein